MRCIPDVACPAECPSSIYKLRAALCQAFVNTLAYAHGDVPVVAALRDEADAAARGMLDALLARLRGPVHLPECLRVIGYLRRLAVFDEQARAGYKGEGLSGVKCSLHVLETHCRDRLQLPERLRIIGYLRRMSVRGSWSHIAETCRSIVGCLHVKLFAVAAEA